MYSFILRRAIYILLWKFDYIHSNLDEFEALGYAPGYFTPTIYEDGEEYEKYKAQGDFIALV